MLQFTNSTPFAGTILLAPDPSGVESLYTIVRGTFAIGDVPVVAEEQSAVATNEEFYGDPCESSLKAPSDVGLIKPGTDVLLQGTAYPPAGGRVTESEVTLAVGSLRKSVRVIGERAWKPGILSEKISQPAPFDMVPLTYENAFGGTDKAPRDEEKVDFEPRNPVGRGLVPNKSQTKSEGIRLPNLEDPNRLITSARDRPPPACFAPLCPHWDPRRRYAGTYDDEWQRHRAPYLPLDFDPRFFQLAPADQVVEGYLQGGEDVEIKGATKSGELRFKLPRYSLQVNYRLDDDDHVRGAHLDTVLIEPDESRLVLIWRTVFACDKRSLRVREIEANAVEDG